MSLRILLRPYARQVCTALAATISVSTPAYLGAADVVPPAIAIQHVTIVDDGQGTSRTSMTVLIAHGRIVRIGPDSVVRVPRGSQIVDGRGRFLIPGLIDMHVHLSESGVQALGMYLDAGVTTVRDMGGSLSLIAKWNAQIRAGTLAGPRIVAVGAMLENAGFMQWLNDHHYPAGDHVAVTSAAAANHIVDSLADAGAHAIKMRTVNDSTIYWAIAAAARRRGLMVVGHAPSHLSPIAAADAGQRSFEHGFFPDFASRLSPDSLALILAAYRRNNVALVPTLAVFEQRRYQPDTLASSISDSALRHDARARLVLPKLIMHWRNELSERREENKQQPQSAASLRGWAAALDRNASDTRLLMRAGVRVLVGSDVPFAQFPGDDSHAEMEALVQRAGFTTAEVLRAATGAAAEFLNLPDIPGRLAEGHAADMVLLDANPLDAVANLRKIRLVIYRGIVRTPARRVSSKQPP